MKMIAKNVALWSLTSITALATICGMILLGGCAPEHERMFETRIDPNGNLATLECIGECLYIRFDEIVPASTQ